MDWRVYAVLGLLLGLTIASPRLMRRYREHRLSKAGLSDLENMTDEAMAKYLAMLFSAMGYRVFRLTTADPEFDLVLLDGLGQKRGVVVRHWRKQVEEQHVLLAAEAAEQSDTASPLMVTVERFTWKARETAREKGVELWGLPELTSAMQRLKEASEEEAPPIPAAAGAPAPAAPLASASAPRGGGRQVTVPPGDLPPAERGGSDRINLKVMELFEDSHVPRCPRCGKRMVVRRNSKGQYWGCPAFPKCLGTREKSP